MCGGDEVQVYAVSFIDDVAKVGMVADQSIFAEIT